MSPENEAETPGKPQGFAVYPDGRIVIEVKGHKFALPTTPDALQNIDFTIEPQEARDILPRYGAIDAKLANVIVHPDLARKAFAAASEVGIFVMPPASETKLARSMGGWRTFHFWVGRDESYTYDHSKCDATNYQLISKRDEDGFEVTRNDHSPASIRYCMPAKDRGFATEKELRFDCENEGGWEYECSAWFYGEHLAVGYSFYRGQFPESDWAALDTRMHNFFNHLILGEEIH